MTQRQPDSLNAMCGWAETLAKKAGWTRDNASSFWASYDSARASAALPDEQANESEMVAERVSILRAFRPGDVVFIETDTIYSEDTFLRLQSRLAEVAGKSGVQVVLLGDGMRVCGRRETDLLPADVETPKQDSFLELLSRFALAVAAATASNRGEETDAIRHARRELLYHVDCLIANKQ